MKNIKVSGLLALFFIIFNLTASAQIKVILRPMNRDFPPFLAVEQEPRFREKYGCLNDLIVRDLRYPQKAIEDNVQGIVVVSCIVNKDGWLTDIEILKSLSPETDAEALRLVSSSPPWMPGTSAGRPLNVRIPIIVTFKLTPGPINFFRYIPEYEIPKVTNSEYYEKSWSNYPDYFSKTNDIFSSGGSDNKPQFPGGEKALEKFIRANLATIPLTNSGYDKVFLAFVVERDGTLSTFEVAGNTDEAYAKKLINAMRKSPKWVHEKVGNDKIRTRVILSLPF